jgi:glycine cleavage system aminomethyltransferase T
MKLDFLSPATGAAGPPARSSIFDAAFVAHRGASVETRRGWDVIASFGDATAEARACTETVGFADLSHLTKIEMLPADPLGAPSGLAAISSGWWVCPVRPDLRLIVSTAAGQPEAPVPAGARTLDLTGSLAAIAIAGPLARETIARFCALDTRERSLPIAGFRPGSIARTAGYLLREDRDRFLLIFGAAYGIYMWEAVSDAAERLGGRPVGADSLPSPTEGTHDA